MDPRNALRPDTPLPVNPHPSKNKKSPQTNELLIASRKGYTTEVKRILAEGGGSVAEPIQDKHGRNCLHLACHYGQLETAQTIINMDVIDIDSTSRRGFTPLHEASGEGYLNVVFLLLAMGAFIKVRSKEGWTALMSACYNGHKDVARILIAAGLDVNAYNKNGFTALHVAAWRGNHGIVELLLKEGAIITMETSNKKTALEIAKEENQLETITILQAASVRESEKPFYRIAALEGQLKLVHEKLMQTQQKHEEILKIERQEMAKTYEDMKQQLIKETTSSDEDQQTKILSDTNEDNDGRNSSETPAIIVSNESPKIYTAKNTKVVKMVATNQQRSSVPTMVSPRLQRQSYSPSVPKLQHRKKAEKKIIDTLCLESAIQLAEDTAGDGVDKRIRRSLDGMATIPKVNGDRMTITQLVENSLQSPGTIASIRKKLKEDGLTPRIKKKFEKQSKQELPTVKDTSQLCEKSLPIKGKRSVKDE